jgi:hypothetical protein
VAERKPAKGSAKGKPRAKAQPKAKKPSKTVRKAKAKPARKSPAPSRARGAVKRGPGRAPKAKAAAAKKPRAPKKTAGAVNPTPPLTPPPFTPPRGRGRPKDTPDVWTQAHIEEVAEKFWNYIESTDCPTEAEFCYLSLVAHQRLGEIPLLRQLKEFMFAKRQAYTTNRGLRLVQGDGPLGAFLAKLAANAGPFSLVDKSESTIRGGPRPFANQSDEELEKIISDELARRTNG